MWCMHLMEGRDLTAPAAAAARVRVSHQVRQELLNEGE